MSCTICRAPFLASVNPIEGSLVKSIVVSSLSAADIAHLSSAKRVSYVDPKVVTELMPVDEHASIFFVNTENAKKVIAVSQESGINGESDFIAHSKCLDILLYVLDIENQKPPKEYNRNLAELHLRMLIGPHGQLLGFCTPTDLCKFQVKFSKKGKEAFKRLQWSDGVKQTWKFADPDTNAENRERIHSLAELISDGLDRAGPLESPLLELLDDIHRSSIMRNQAFDSRAIEFDAPIDNSGDETDWYYGPALLEPQGTVATEWALLGGLRRTIDVWRHRLYPFRQEIDRQDALLSKHKRKRKNKNKNRDKDTKLMKINTFSFGDWAVVTIYTLFSFFFPPPLPDSFEWADLYWYLLFSYLLIGIGASLWRALVHDGH